MMRNLMRLIMNKKRKRNQMLLERLLLFTAISCKRLNCARVTWLSTWVIYERIQLS